MKPLNLRNYILLSLKKVSPQVILLMIKIALFVFLCSIGFAVVYGLNKGSNLVIDEYASITFKSYVTDDRKEEILEEILEQKGFEKELQGTALSAGMGKLIIFNSFAWIFEVNKEDGMYILDSIDATLTEGRMPEAENELILSQELINGMNKEIGDYVGLEEQLPQRFKITGVYEGKANVFISFDAGNSGYIYKVKNNHIEGFYNHLKTYDEVIIQTDRDDIFEIMNNIFFLLKVIGILILFITAVEVTISVSNLNKVYFTERLGEFAILQAVGYSERFIISRMLKELSIIIITGLSGGLLLGHLIMTLFYYLYCEGRGIPYRIFEFGILYLSIALGIIIFLLTFIPIRKYIKKMDWVNVIQESNT